MMSSRSRSRPLCQPPDRRLRKVARQAGRIDRDLGTDRSRTVPGVDSRLLCNAHVTHGALRHLWARTRIAVLSDFGPLIRARSAWPRSRRSGSPTACSHDTSFVAVQEIVRTAESADDVDQPLPLPAGVSDLAVGVTAGPEPNIVWVASIVVALVGCGSLLRRRRRTGARHEDQARICHHRDPDRLGSEAPLRGRAAGRPVLDSQSDGLVSATTGETFVMQSGEGISRATACS